METTLRKIAMPTKEEVFKWEKKFYDEFELYPNPSDVIEWLQSRSSSPSPTEMTDEEIDKIEFPNMTKAGHDIAHRAMKFYRDHLRANEKGEKG